MVPRRSRSVHRSRRRRLSIEPLEPRRLLSTLAQSVLLDESARREETTALVMTDVPPLVAEPVTAGVNIREDNRREDAGPEPDAATITHTSPVNGATDVPLYSLITVTFSGPMNPTTITTDTFFLKDAANNLVGGTVSYDDLSLTATFNPFGELSTQTSYTATVTTGVSDAGGDPLASNYSWSFSTGGLYDPDIGTLILDGNDDGSTDQIALPFTVNVYDNAYNSFWINNNGNVTFDGPLFSYSSEAFPNDSGWVIVAPFWGDVDTRPAASGKVYLKSTPDRVVVTWLNVGYFAEHTDKLNTFQLILTPETTQAPGLFGFSYADMEWTTGDASGGSGGFGGVAARGGFDAGDGQNALTFWQGNTAASLQGLINQTFWYSNRGGEWEPNQPPVVNAGPDQFVELTLPAGATVTLDGSRTSDDGLITPLEYTWTEGATVLGTGVQLEVFMTPGQHLVTLTAFDGQFQRADDVVITVQDTTPPETTITAGPAEGAFIVDEDVTFAWTGSDGGTATQDLMYSYSMDGSPFSAFSSSTSMAFVGLSDGDHTFAVRARDASGLVDPTPAERNFSVISGLRILEMTPQPSSSSTAGVDTIALRLNDDVEPATLWAPSFQLLGSGGDGDFTDGDEVIIDVVDVAWNGATNTITLSFAGDLPRDTYELTVFDELRNLEGERLDGEFEGTFPSGDSTEGGDFVATFTVTNTPPQAFAGQVSTLQGVPVELVLTGQDADGDPLEFSIRSGPWHGTLTPGTDSAHWLYTPETGYHGQDSFTFVANDGTVNSATATFRMDVVPEPCDLEPTTLAVVSPSQFSMGDTITLNWTGTNHGPGETLSAWGTDWQDYVFLSTDDVLDADDVYLGAWLSNASPVAAGGTYNATLDVTLPTDGEWSGDYYLILAVNGDRGQVETDLTNNVLALAIEIDPGVTLTSPWYGRYVDCATPLEFAWVDADQAYSAEIAIAVDADDDPTNGVGHQWLATGLSEDDDGEGDAAQLFLPALTPREDPYYVWVRLSNPEGDYYSEPVPIQVFDRAYYALDGQGDALGGSGYEVYGVEAGLIGSVVHYRVLTNYQAAASGGDVYINVGGTWQEGTGTVHGIAVNALSSYRQMLSAGDLYTDATFRTGVIFSTRPTFITDSIGHVSGSSTAVVSSPAGIPSAYQVEGTFDTAALPGYVDQSIQIAWAMYCGNDIGDVLIPGTSAPDLAVTSVKYRPDEGIAGGIHESAEPGRAGVWQVTVTNVGGTPVNGPWTLHWLLSQDQSLDPGWDLTLTAAQVRGESFAVGQSYVIELPAFVPDTPDAAEGGYYYFGAAVTGLNGETYEDNNALVNPESMWIQQVAVETDPATEDNDTAATAYVLDVSGGSAHLADRTIDAANDDDWYAIQLDQAAPAGTSVSIHFDTNRGDLDLYLYHSSDTQNPIGASTEPDSDTETLSLEGLPAGLYYVKVVGSAGAGGLVGDVSPAYVMDVFTEAPETLTITGHITYLDSDAAGTTYDAAFVKVEAWESNAGQDTLIAWGYTDASGDYFLTLDVGGQPILNRETSDGETGTRDIYLKVYAENEAAEVVFYRMPGIPNPYVAGSAVFDDVPGAVAQIDLHIVSTENTNDHAAAFGIPGYLKGVRDWFEGEVGWTRPQVSVVYPAPLEGLLGTTSQYYAFVDQIHLVEDWAAEDNAAHEYAHAIHKTAREEGELLPCLALPGGSHTTHNLWYEAYGLFGSADEGFALAEGWAEFIKYAYQANNWLEGDPLGSGPYWMGDDGQGAAGRQDRVNENGNTGENVEGAIASIFWDLYDGASATDDTVNPSLDRLWTVLRSDDPDTIWDPSGNDDFYHAWNDHFGQTRAVDEIFIDHGVPVLDDAYDGGEYDLGSGNDSRAQAADLGTIDDNWAESSLILVDPDWYRFQVPAHAVVAVSATFQASKGDLDLIVYDRYGQEVARGADFVGANDWITSTVVGLRQGIYYVQVVGAEDLQTAGNTGTTYEGDFSPNYTLDFAKAGDAAPIVHAPDPAVTEEDTPVTFALPGTDPDGDPIVFEIVSAPAHGDVSLVGDLVTYTPDASWWGEDAFTFRAYDGNSYSGEAAVSVTVAPVNDAPVVTGIDHRMANDAGQIVSAGTFADPDPNDSWTATVDYGDGTGAHPLTLEDHSFELNHSYTHNGTYTVTVTVMDAQGATGTSSFVAVVWNVAPVIDGDQAATVNEGTAFVFTGTVIDPNGDDVVYHWDFGDGSSAGEVGATHTYAEDGTYTATLTATDEQGATSTQTVTVTVNNVAPQFDLGPARTVVEEVASVFAATVTDPGSFDTHTYLWDFGDGTTSTLPSLSHTYLEPGVYTVALTVTDDDGGVTTDTVQVTVQNQSPTITGTSVANGSGQRSDVRTLQVVFREDVDVEIEDLLLVNMGMQVGVDPVAQVMIVPACFQYDPQTFTLTLAFPHSLPEGYYELRINGQGITDSAGQFLYQGSATNPAVDRPFHCLTGDLNGDSVVNVLDVARLRAALGGPYDPEADVNGDGVLDNQDVTALRSRLGAYVGFANAGEASVKAADVAVASSAGAGGRAAAGVLSAVGSLPAPVAWTFDRSVESERRLPVMLPPSLNVLGADLGWALEDAVRYLDEHGGGVSAGIDVAADDDGLSRGAGGEASESEVTSAAVSIGIESEESGGGTAAESNGDPQRSSPRTPPLQALADALLPDGGDEATYSLDQDATLEVDLRVEPAAI